ncbi:hypothetical protein DL769_003849 [Monosporascus sp. CRB-8-3]|nr:hypothetical protein DL769_003849 [Monosporascus sp. CRB-8-3]
MQPPAALLGLPPSLLLLVAAQIQAQELPTAIKKMSLDAGEKLFPEHYAFAPLLPLGARSPLAPPFAASEDDELLPPSGNNTTATATALPFRAPFAVHHDYYLLPRQRRHSGDGVGLYERAGGVLARLRGRQFACPRDTAPCDNIGQPNYCCEAGAVCFEVTDAPAAGNVGCCPDGRNCDGGVGDCGGGSTACPAEVGGGCCIAGFVCAEVGCVASSVSVITQTTTTPSPTTEAETPYPTTTTTTNTGGDALPPVRPTSSASAPSSSPSDPDTTTPPPTTTLNPSSSPPSSDYCPTGFYACVASAGGGCCRTGRDCATTSCPPPAAMTTITNNDGATVAVPGGTDAPPTGDGASEDQGQGQCAGGWFLCPEDEGGPVPGCCPEGYGCGTASCTLAQPSATDTVQKQMPGSAGARWGVPAAWVALAAAGAGVWVVLF